MIMRSKKLFFLLALAVAHGESSTIAGQCPTFITSSNGGYYYRGNSYLSHSSSGFAAGGEANVEYRSFVAFDVPALPELPASAELWISSQYLTSSDETETLEIREVTNSLETVQAYGVTESAVFDDLGDGVLYGTAVISTIDRGKSLIIPLNQAFLSKLAASQGSNLVIGAALSTLNADETDREDFQGGFQGPGIRLALTFPSSPSPLQILEQPGGMDLLEGQEASLRVL